MDIQQGYIPAKDEHQVHHYSEDRISPSDYNNKPTSTSNTTTTTIPTILPTLVEEEYNATAGDITAAVNDTSNSIVTPVQMNSNNEASSSSQMITSTADDMEQDDDEDEEDDGNSLNPALLLNRYDKRKSSPAILGLPFGLNHEAQLSLHLSQQRNSIEAAMLLANFNKLMAFPKANENEHKGHPQQQQWQDDMSIPSQNKNSWGDVLSSETDANRRHSYDVNMSWHTMSEAFLERPDLLHNISSSSSSTNAALSSSTTTTATSVHPHHPLHYNNHHPEAPVFKQENFYSNTPTKVSWSHDDLHHPPPQHPHHHQQQAQHPYNVEYTNHPISPRQHNSRLYHPTMSSPLAPHGYQQPRYPPLPSHGQQPQQQDSQQQQHPGLMLHPLARQPDNNNSGMKRELDPNQQQHQQYYSYTFPPQHPMQQQQQRYYYPSSNGKLPLPSPHHHQGPMDPNQPPPQHPHLPHQPIVHHPPPILAKPKRKKQKSNSTDDYDEEIVETNEEDYPDMSTRDVEAARSDPEARPRKQKLRFTGDKYTPQWVRYNGQSKEGLCDTCKPGKWLQLKNSAYWYHKQFFHGISSVSGKEFVQPLETRWVDQDLVEGLCHQCHQWVAVSNVKRKNSVLWYRHAHKCHVYHKPKPNVPKKR